MRADQHFCVAVIVLYAKVARAEFLVVVGIQHVRSVAYPTICSVPWPQTTFGNNRFRFILEKQHTHLDPLQPVF